MDDVMKSFDRGDSVHAAILDFPKSLAPPVSGKAYNNRFLLNYNEIDIKFFSQISKSGDGAS